MTPRDTQRPELMLIEGGSDTMPCPKLTDRDVLEGLAVDAGVTRARVETIDERLDRIEATQRFILGAIENLTEAVTTALKERR